ncbi:MAG: aldehyde dehydrogenase family protein [Phycisphaerales bacterium]
MIAPAERTAPHPDDPTAWAEQPASPLRMAWLRRFRAAVAGAREELAGLIEQDTGKPARDALVQDIVPLLSACRWLERRAPSLLRERAVGWGGLWTLGQSHRVRRVPLGTVGIIATWNYPVQLLGIQLVHALTAGNRVIVKPSENSPLSQTRLLELARAAGLTSSELEWTEPSREAGPRMLREHRLDHLVFTGSTKVGRAIAAWAGETLTPTTLELSGCDSAFVLEDADAALAARSIWAAATINAGQTCMAPRRALVLRDVYAEFLKALAPLAASAKPVAMVNEAAAQRVWDVARDTIAQNPDRQEGVSSSLQRDPRKPLPHGRGSARTLSGVMEPARGRHFTPTAIVDCHGDESAVRGEHFGPLLAVVPVDSIEAALAIHRACPQHLSASVFTRRPRSDQSLQLAEALGAGIVTFNDAVLPSAHPGVCLAGRGESGWGVSRGAEGLLAMTRAVHVSRTSPSIRPPVEPMTAATAAVLSKLTGWMYGAPGKKAVPNTSAPGEAAGAISARNRPSPAASPPPRPDESLSPARRA